MKPHNLQTLVEPRPKWVEELYGDDPVSACVWCGIVVVGATMRWLPDCIAEPLVAA